MATTAGSTPRTGHQSAPHSFFAERHAGTAALFEIDYEWQQGWSVLIGGQIARVDRPEERRKLHALWPRPWADGRRDLLARVTPVEVTGRRLGDA